MDNQYTKNCSKCSTLQVFTSLKSLKRSTKLNTLCKRCSNQFKAYCDGNCSVLLQDSVLSYYWIGFIMADGHIGNNMRLKVTLSSKDKNHLDTLRKYLCISKFREDKDSYVTISIMDTINLTKFTNKFNIHSNKTENPCDISSIKDDLLTAWIIGFIDSDGSIVNKHRCNKAIRIKCHNSWLDNLNFIAKHLQIKDAYINNQGYASLHINHKISKQMKILGELKQLPMMERKWELI